MGIGVGIGIRIAAGSWSTIPFYSDAVSYWDGTIITDGGSPYFVDKKGVGNLQMFTWNGSAYVAGNDFPVGWVRGFPFKSATFVSAPAGNQTLINADVNNFFYDSGGTPNKIPVICFSNRNIDYANKLYAKIYEQSVNPQGIETYEARVKEIVLYNSARTGDKITRCDSYFVVPTKDTTARWVDFVNGLDANDGTENKPFKTINKINTLSLTSGSTIYVKTGISTNTGQQEISKPYKFIGIGNCRIISSSYGFYITATGGEVDIKGFAVTSTSSSIYTNNAINNRINNCMLSSGSLIASSASNYYTNCIMYGGGIKVNEASNIHTISMQGCYHKYLNATTYSINFSTNTRNCIYTIYNNKLGSALTLATGTWDVKGNYFQNRAIRCDSSANHTGTVDFQYNTLKPEHSTLTLMAFGISGNAYNNYDVIVENNNIEDIYSDSEVLILREQKTIRVANNMYRHIGNAASNYRFRVINAINTATSCVITNNGIYSSTWCAPICVGDEYAGNANKVTNATITNNVCYNTERNSSHGIAVFRLSNYLISKNKIIRFGIGVVTKALGTESSGGVVSYNLLTECGNNLLSKGCNGVKFYNNTIYTYTSINYAFGVILTEYSGAVDVTNNEFKNNIIYDMSPSSGVPDADVMLYTAGLTINQLNNWGNVFSNNCIFTSHNKYANGINTLADAQALGIENGSVSTNPHLDANLIPASKINIGAVLDPAFDDGLDVYTNWGSSTQVPTIVTKQQTEAQWQVGAYVK